MEGSAGCRQCKPCEKIPRNGDDNDDDDHDYDDDIDYDDVHHHEKVLYKGTDRQTDEKYT